MDQADRFHAGLSLLAAAQNLVAGLANLLSGLLVQIRKLGCAIGCVAGVAAGASSSFWIYCLPACKKNMKMVVYRRLVGDNGLVAFQAVIITNCVSQWSRLDGCACIKCQGVMRSKQLSRDAPGHPCARMAVDTARVFGRMRRSQIHWLGIH